MTHFGRQTRIKFLGGELLVRIEGDDATAVSLDNIVRRSSDLRIPFQKFQPVWFDSMQRVFDAGGDPVPWPELSPAYAGWKQATHPGKPILRLSDRMYESLTAQTGDTVWKVTPRTIQFGSRVPYFMYHQEGTTRMPARPMLTLPADAAAALVSLVLGYIRDGA